MKIRGAFCRVSASAVPFWGMLADARAVPIPPESLRLVPFPNEIRTAEGGLRLEGSLVIKVVDTESGRQAAAGLEQELARRVMAVVESAGGRLGGVGMLAGGWPNA